MSHARGADASANVWRHAPAFRWLWGASTVSHVGDGAALIALVLYAKAVGGSGVAVGALLLAEATPHLLGPLAGVVGDLRDRRAVMIACEWSQAGLFAALAWWQPPFAALLALVLVASTLDTVFSPASAGALPMLVDRDDLLQANAWMGTSANLPLAVGPALGGALVAAFGPRGGLAANAASFALSGLLLLRLPALRGAADAGRASVGAAAREALAFVWRDRVVRAVIVPLFPAVAFAALDNVALVFLVRDVLHGGALAFGLASASFGVGMLCASLGLTVRRVRARSAVLLLVAWALTGTGTLATGLAPAFAVLCGAQLVSGAGNGIANVAAATAIQERVPGPMLGRVFGLVGTAGFGGSALAYAAGGFLLDATSPRVTFVLAGAGVCVVLVLMAALLRSVAWSSAAAAAG